MALSVLISVVRNICLVLAVSALVSTAYVRTGLTHALYIRTLVLLDRYLFLHIIVESAPDIFIAFCAACLVSDVVCRSLVISAPKYVNYHYLFDDFVFQF